LDMLASMPSDMGPVDIAAMVCKGLSARVWQMPWGPALQEKTPEELRHAASLFGLASPADESMAVLAARIVRAAVAPPLAENARKLNAAVGKSRVQEALVSPAGLPEEVWIEATRMSRPPECSPMERERVIRHKLARIIGHELASWSRASLLAMMEAFFPDMRRAPTLSSRRAIEYIAAHTQMLFSKAEAVESCHLEGPMLVLRVCFAHERRLRSMPWLRKLLAMPMPELQELAKGLGLPYDVTSPLSLALSIVDLGASKPLQRNLVNHVLGIEMQVSHSAQLGACPEAIRNEFARRCEARRRAAVAEVGSELKQ